MSIEVKKEGGLIYRDSQGNKILESSYGDDISKYYAEGITETHTDTSYLAADDRGEIRRVSRIISENPQVFGELSGDSPFKRAADVLERLTSR